VDSRFRLPLGIHDVRQFTNITTCNCERYIPRASPLLESLVGIDVGFGARRMSQFDEPCHVAQEIDVPRIADAKSSSRAMPMQLTLAQYFAQRRRVQQATEFARSKFAGVSC